MWRGRIAASGLLAACREVQPLAHGHLFQEGEELLAGDLSVFVCVHVFEEDVPVAHRHLRIAETALPLFFRYQAVAVLR